MTGATIKRESEKRSPPSFRKPAQFVTIIVSKAPTVQKFVVHKELICFHSPFFQAAFNGKFIEGQTQEMRMDDVDEETFGHLVHWLYTQELERTEIEDVLVLGNLWILAERALIPKLQNSTIDALYPILLGPDVVIPSDFRKMKRLLDIVFGEKREEHPILRSLLVDHFACLTARQLNPCAKSLPQQLLIPLTVALCKDREDSQGKWKSVLATSKKATDYYVKVRSENKDEAAKSQPSTDDKSDNRIRLKSLPIKLDLQPLPHSSRMLSYSHRHDWRSDEEVEDRSPPRSPTRPSTRTVHPRLNPSRSTAGSNLTIPKGKGPRT